MPAAKVLPNNLEAEESVLGSCFLSKYALQKASESLTAESFYNEKNAKIFLQLHVGANCIFALHIAKRG